MTVVQPRSLDQLTLVAARLARSSPTLWDEFRKQMADCARERMALCVQAPPDQVVIAQGMARQMFELCTLFDNAVAQATRLEDKLKERNHGR